jgi:hypothetical protein
LFVCFPLIGRREFWYFLWGSWNSIDRSSLWRKFSFTFKMNLWQSYGKQDYICRPCITWRPLNIVSGAKFENKLWLPDHISSKLIWSVSFLLSDDPWLLQSENFRNWYELWSHSLICDSLWRIYLDKNLLLFLVLKVVTGRYEIKNLVITINIFVQILILCNNKK